jgi:TonB family protein
MLSEPVTQLERRIKAMGMTTRRLARATVYGGTTLALAALAFACSLQSENPVAPGPQPVNENQTYFEFQVEKLVSPFPGNSPPRYPDMLRSANVEGEVLAQFVVDTTGRVDMREFKVLKSTHDLFTNAVKNALPQMKFYPAQVGGKNVKQLVQMPFQFSLSLSNSQEVTNGPVVIPGAETGKAAAMRRAQLTPQRVSANQTFFEFQVEKSVSGRADNVPPRYPDALRSAKVQGEVLAQFVVDQTGTPDVTTFKVLKSTNELFTEAVQNALPAMRFNPAEVGGRPVKQLVQMPFQFSLTKN